MEKLTIKKQIEHYRDEFNDAVYHPILNRDIGSAQLDDTTAFFLLLPKLNGEKWTESMNTAAIAVGAVYAAFEIHDKVDEETVTTPTQQLAVLSGDYLSGIYYQLLATLPDFQLIHVLSTAIGEINELKTDFHHGNPAHLQDHIEAVKIIKAKCVIEFLHTFGFSKYVPIVEAALPLSSLNLVGHNTHEGKNKSWAIPIELEKEAGLTLKEELEQSLSNANFIASFLKEEIQEIITPLLGKMI